MLYFAEPITTKTVKVHWAITVWKMGKLGLSLAIIGFQTYFSIYWKRSEEKFKLIYGKNTITPYKAEEHHANKHRKIYRYTDSLAHSFRNAWAAVWKKLRQWLKWVLLFGVLCSISIGISVGVLLLRKWLNSEQHNSRGEMIFLVFGVPSLLHYWSTEILEWVFRFYARKIHTRGIYYIESSNKSGLITKLNLFSLFNSYNLLFLILILRPHMTEWFGSCVSTNDKFGAPNHLECHSEMQWHVYFQWFFMFGGGIVKSLLGS
jgi:hypothetical protein